MRAAFLSILLLTACYDKGDAVKQLQNMGRPLPIQCVSLNGRDGESNAAFACTDGEKISWACDSEGCIRWTR